MYLKQYVSSKDASRAVANSALEKRNIKSSDELVDNRLIIKSQKKNLKITQRAIFKDKDDTTSYVGPNKLMAQISSTLKQSNDWTYEMEDKFYKYFFGVQDILFVMAKDPVTFHTLDYVVKCFQDTLQGDVNKIRINQLKNKLDKKAFQLDPDKRKEVKYLFDLDSSIPFTLQVEDKSSIDSTYRVSFGCVLQALTRRLGNALPKSTAQEMHDYIWSQGDFAKYKHYDDDSVYPGLYRKYGLTKTAGTGQTIETWAGSASNGKYIISINTAGADGHMVYGQVSNGAFQDSQDPGNKMALKPDKDTVMEIWD